MPQDSAYRPIETVARPFAGTTAGRSSKDDWRPLFASYSEIVLVANSDEVDIDALRASLPGDALFVFFNKVYKVLDRPFDGNVLLAVRSGRGGPHIVSRGQVGDVVSYFPTDGFLGIMCMRAAPVEPVTPASAFGGVPTGHLDLADYFGISIHPTICRALALHWRSGCVNSILVEKSCWPVFLQSAANAGRYSTSTIGHSSRWCSGCLSARAG